MFGAILSGVGSILGGALGFMGASKANDTNRDIASANVEFQREQAEIAREYNTTMVGRQEAFQRDTINSAMAYNTQMANTSYQRGMADMRQAGLNPILAYAQGGATSPTGPAGSGASASSPSPSGSVARVENAMSPAIASAMQGARVVTELEQLAANVQQTRAQTDLLQQQERHVKANTALDTARWLTEGYMPENIQARTRTEQGRPELIGSQVATNRASAANIAAQTETERQRPDLVRAQTATEQERPGQVREDTRRSGADANRSLIQGHHLRTYGPPGHISSTVGGISQISGSVLDALRRALQ